MSEETLFEAALKVPDAERGAFLDRECGGDVELRARVEALLAARAAHAPSRNNIETRGSWQEGKKNNYFRAARRRMRCSQRRHTA